MLNEEPSGGAEAVRVADAYATEDARRKEWLDWLVKRGGTCRGCGATVADAQLELHPGVCGTCFTKKHVQPLIPPASIVAPEPKEEDPMPCSSCGSKDHNKRTCPKVVKPAAPRAVAPVPAKAAAPTPPKPAVVVPAGPPPRRSGGFNLTAATVAELVDTIAACKSELARRQAQLEEQLAAVRKAVAA